MEPSNQSLSSLLYKRECPFGYQCKTNDCMECAKIHMEKGETDGKS